MPRERPKKANKFTRAEICRRSRNKRKQEDPEGYKEKLAVQRKKNNITRIRTNLSICSKLKKNHCYLITRKNKRKKHS